MIGGGVDGGAVVGRWSGGVMWVVFIGWCCLLLSAIVLAVGYA